MEWEFTPEQVVKGEMEYGLVEFRTDLHREVRQNLPPGVEEDEIDGVFTLVYDLCYWLATGGDFEDFEAQFEHDPTVGSFVRTVRDHGTANVEMLGAILQRLIMEGVEAGKGVEEAVAAAAEYHMTITGGGQINDGY